MKLLVAAVLLVTTTAPVLAEDCAKGWRAGISEEEGGAVMQAEICDARDPQVALHVECGGEGKVALRYLPPAKENFPPQGNPEYASAFDFASKAMTATLDMRYEAMDGVMAATPARKSDVVKLLMTGDKVTVTDKSGLLPAVTFPLKGSGAAIQKVMDACYS